MNDVLVVSLGALVAYSWYQWRESGGAVPALNLFPDLLSVDASLEPEAFPEGVSSAKVWPRGIRNNNPGNIRYTGTRWQGLSDPSSDGEYCIFINVRYGIRAMSKILKSYAGRGLVSIEDIISTWAPDSENNTASYIYSVAQRMGVDISEALDKSDWPALIEAIIYHENGVQPYSMQIIKEGVSLA